MAQRVNVVLVDDIDGTEAQETVQFSLDGVSYEIDLNKQNADDLRVVLAPYVGAARTVRGRRRVKRSSTPAPAPRAGARRSRSGSTGPKEIREWALENGYEVGKVGRISRPVREAFEAAH